MAWLRKQMVINIDLIDKLKSILSKLVFLQKPKSGMTQRNHPEQADD